MRRVFMIAAAAALCSAFCSAAQETFPIMVFSTMTASPAMAVPGMNVPGQTNAPSAPLPDDPAKLVNKLASTVPVNEQSMAADKLVKMGVKSLTQLYDTLHNDKRTYVRVKTAGILGRIKSDASVPELAATASTQYMALNKAVVRALNDIGTPAARAALKDIKAHASDPALILYINEVSSGK